MNRTKDREQPVVQDATAEHLARHGFGESSMTTDIPHHATDGTPGRQAQELSFTIVDDPRNTDVFKGAGNYAATRGESAIRIVEKAFPGLRFSFSSNRLLTFLSARASIDFPIENDTFVVVLTGALTATGTRLAPQSGDPILEARGSPATNMRRVDTPALLVAIRR